MYLEKSSTMEGPTVWPARLVPAPRGTMLHAPDVYMEKLAIGPGFRRGIVTLDMSPSARVSALAAARGRSLQPART